ncbi:SRPBCC family protein [Saccharopolyspora sp. K220]|uniref:SRPBCC family protein n=1 Tax=Saccharopolyspora soli TaxID=2926618 RepID=UPI001F59A5B5|nr:SRPBCC family protein [Saccharopolyspora soli]MCI2423485.1 SRPBCC family protein [Saccharopolyspora soli]
MIDIAKQVTAVQRVVSQHSIDGGERVSVLLRRNYAAPIEDVWSALAEPGRLRRWFLPITGELREGGRFQLEGNAGGEIIRCEAPRLLKMTFGAETSVVELRLSEVDGATGFEMMHSVPVQLAGNGAGALFVGPGWDVNLLALELFLRGEVFANPVGWQNSPEVQRFSRQTIKAWAAAAEDSGTADGDQIAQGIATATAQFTPDLDPSTA